METSFADEDGERGGGGRRRTRRRTKRRRRRRVRRRRRERRVCGRVRELDQLFKSSECAAKSTHVHTRKEARSGESADVARTLELDMSCCGWKLERCLLRAICASAGDDAFVFDVTLIKRTMTLVFPPSSRLLPVSFLPSSRSSNIFPFFPLLPFFPSWSALLPILVRPSSPPNPPFFPSWSALLSLLIRPSSAPGPSSDSPSLL